MSFSTIYDVMSDFEGKKLPPGAYATALRVVHGVLLRLFIPLVLVCALFLPVAVLVSVVSAFLPEPSAEWLEKIIDWPSRIEVPDQWDVPLILAGFVLMLILKITNMAVQLDDHATWTEQARAWFSSGDYMTTEGGAKRWWISDPDSRSAVPMIATLEVDGQTFRERPYQEALRFGFWVGRSVRITHHAGEILKVEVSDESRPESAL